MSERSVTPICAFDVGRDGSVSAIDDPWPATTIDESVAYRWIHFDLADSGLEEWSQEFLSPIVSGTLRQTETRPRCDLIGDGLILNLRGVNLNPGSDPDDMVSLRLWVTHGLIVSARIRKVWAVDAIRQQMANGSAPDSVSMFLSALTYGLTKRIEEVSIALEEEADAIEEDALTNPQEISGRIAHCRQSVIKLRRFIRPQREALMELAGNTDWLKKESASVLIHETANRTTRTVEALDATHDRLAATQDHLDILHATALGRNSYVLSVVAAIFLPLGFLTGLFGINVGGMPGVESAYGFWIVTGGSIIIGVILFAIFRFAKWL